jgi:hypothetical protein
LIGIAHEDHSALTDNVSTMEMMLGSVSNPKIRAGSYTRSVPREASAF